LTNDPLYAILSIEEVDRMAKRGRKPKYNLKDEACPNPKCSLYGKTAKGNIVSNGTIPTKQGENRRKFLCKVCGRSFCSRTGTVFYDLRTPEEKVLLALKLLVKGMPLRGVADVLKVKLDTVRHWLKVAAEHSERVNKMLLAELSAGSIGKVSQVELDALWTFVKKNALRKRAILWKEKSGWGFPLPKNRG
jgi:transposase-like protein